MFYIQDTYSECKYRWFDELENATEYCRKINTVLPDRFRVRETPHKTDPAPTYEADKASREQRGERYNRGERRIFFDYNA